LTAISPIGFVALPDTQPVSRVGYSQEIILFGVMDAVCGLILDEKDERPNP
jgi:hypothetical protein